MNKTVNQKTPRISNKPLNSQSKTEYIQYKSAPILFFSIIQSILIGLVGFGIFLIALPLVSSMNIASQLLGILVAGTQGIIGLILVFRAVTKYKEKNHGYLKVRHAVFITMTTMILSQIILIVLFYLSSDFIATITIDETANSILKLSFLMGSIFGIITVPFIAIIVGLILGISMGNKPPIHNKFINDSRV